MHTLQHRDNIHTIQFSYRWRSIAGTIGQIGNDDNESPTHLLSTLLCQTSWCEHNASIINQIHKLMQHYTDPQHVLFLLFRIYSCQRMLTTILNSSRSLSQYIFIYIYIYIYIYKCVCIYIYIYISIQKWIHDTSITIQIYSYK